MCMCVYTCIYIYIYIDTDTGHDLPAALHPAAGRSPGAGALGGGHRRGRQRDARDGTAAIYIYIYVCVCIYKYV